MTTIPFGPRRDEDRLMARAGELQQDVAPPRDLWPGIQARLDEGERRPAPWSFGWPAALAAGFLVAAVSALLTWGLLREPAPVAGTLAGGAEPAQFVPVAYGPNSGIGAAQLAARDELLPEFRRRFGQLAPATQAVVLKNLAVMQQAADEIDAALAADPASGLLNEMLAGTYRQELGLYSRVVTSGGGSNWST